MKPKSEITAEDFARLPDDSLVPTKLAALILNTSRWTLERSAVLRRIRLSERCSGYRAGDIRALVRGEKVNAA